MPTRGPRPVLRYLVLLFCLAACAPRGELTFVPVADPRAVERKVFVATTRMRAGPARFSGARSEKVHFATYRVAIPPARETGEVSFPKETPDLTRDFVTTAAEVHATPQAFTAALGRELRQRPAGRRSALIFTHGFNNTFAEGLYRTAQMSEDFGLQEVALQYAWPSAGSPFGYAHDRDSALFGRSGFARFLDSVVAAGPDQLIIVAHSMGALLTMETLRQMALTRPGWVARNIDTLVLFAPDIDIDVFRSQVRDIGTLPAGFYVFTSQRDRALGLSARLSGQPERLGNLKDLTEVADLDITILDVSAFSSGLGHFTPATSPELISLLRNGPAIQAALNQGAQARPGLLPGTVLTLQNATEIVLSPLTALAAP